MRSSVILDETPCSVILDETTSSVILDETACSLIEMNQSFGIILSLKWIQSISPKWR